MLERKFMLDAKLEAHVGDSKIIGDVGGDLFLIPGRFVHKIHGPFEMGFIGDPPKLLIRHNKTGRVGYVEVSILLAELGKEMVRQVQ